MTPERTNRLQDVLDKRQANLTIVLENVFDPHNVSAVMRTCDAVGIQEIYILNNRIAPHRKWGFRSSSTAAKWLTIHQYTDVEKCFADLRNQYQKIYASYLDQASTDLYDLNLTESVALVFGNETFGISDEIRKYTDGNFIIPQMGIIKSLNISVACAVSLYEAMRQKRIAGHYDAPGLPHKKLLELKEQWGMIKNDD